MPEKSYLGEEITLQVDIAHTAGGAWGTSNYETLGAAETIDRSPGVQSAQFKNREKKHYTYRRSTIRDMQLDVVAYVKPGNAAFDRLQAAANNANNDGSEIVRVLYCEGDPDVAGNFFFEGDVVVTENGGAKSDFAEGVTKTFELRMAEDSPNDPVEGTTSGV